jgi:prophage antirepressor-like protein
MSSQLISCSDIKKSQSKPRYYFRVYDSYGTLHYRSLLFDYNGFKIHAMYYYEKAHFDFETICELLNIPFSNKIINELAFDWCNDSFNLDKNDNFSPLMISEDGLNILIQKSKRPGAKLFQRWVRNTVIPAVKTHSILNNKSVILINSIRTSQNKKLSLDQFKDIFYKRYLYKKLCINQLIAFKLLCREYAPENIVPSNLNAFVQINNGIGKLLMEMDSQNLFLSKNEITAIFNIPKVNLNRYDKQLFYIDDLRNLIEWSIEPIGVIIWRIIDCWERNDILFDRIL